MSVLESESLKKVSPNRSAAEGVQSNDFLDRRLSQIPFGNQRRVNFPIIFAPMAGLSHVAFRQLVRTYLPANAETLLFTEMLSTRLLPSEEVGETPQTKIAEGEEDLVPQLLGNDESCLLYTSDAADE